MRALLTLLLLLGLCACSTLTDFVLLNDSGKPLTVTLTYQRPPHQIGLLSREAFEAGEPWQPLKTKEQDLEVEVQLKPGEALRTSEELNYTGHDRERLNLKKAVIARANSEDVFEGKALQNLYKKEDGRYIFRYGKVDSKR